MERAPSISQLQQFCIAVVSAVLLTSTVARAQDATQAVQQAVDTELAADRNDHTHWLYYDEDRKPKSTVKQWAAETSQYDLYRVLSEAGRTLPESEQRNRIDSFRRDSGAQAKQKKSGAEDNRQATQLLKLLPQAFLWTRTSATDTSTIYHFKPRPGFDPPTREARVFAAMEGDMTVDNHQHRIAMLKGRLIRDVKFGGGLLGRLQSGGTFSVERRELTAGVWQITETHIHIQGHALLFKSISEVEDETKSKFRRLDDNITPDKAEKELFSAPK
jgi:hypothetical protein